MILFIICLDINVSIELETKHGPFAKTLPKYFLCGSCNHCSCFYSQASQAVFKKSQCGCAELLVHPLLFLLWGFWWKEAIQNPRGEEE